MKASRIDQIRVSKMTTQKLKRGTKSIALEAMSKDNVFNSLITVKHN